MECPKRVLHFSDGTLEEFDNSDDNVECEQKQANMEVAENELQWGPWLFYKATKFGTTVLTGCDYVGESLASFLGITSPKYESEIAEFKRIQAQNEQIERERAENASWMEKENLNGEIIISEKIAGSHEKF
ncbi:unnamed protein product [Hermetia illucens]|uniref:Protein FAM177A1 n=2 Tax=Hermetia illucens TaxID=343691 RepID=A0A7R8UT77_HERIL|nr:unnamed protein product [Hermetia illucens]